MHDERYFQQMQKLQQMLQQSCQIHYSFCCWQCRHRRRCCCQPPLLKYLMHLRSLAMSLRMRIRSITISVTSLTLKCKLLQKEIVSILQKRIRTLSPHSHTQITLDIQCYLAIGRDKKDDCLESTRVETKKNVAYINQLPALS